MSQDNNSVNFVIRDASGQQRMVKLLPNNHSVPVSVKSNPVKFVKIASTSRDTQRAPVYKTLKLGGIDCTSRIVQLPPEALSKLKLVTPKVEPEDTELPQEPVELSDFDIINTAESGEIFGEDLIISAETYNTSTVNLETRVMSQHGTRRKHEPDPDSLPEYTTKRRRHADKVGKGLRHFSMKVCEKVRTKGFTSYNEVADELVMEFANGMHGSGDSQHYDQKNIRRRVYDALNVLMAMNIISKDKKEIRWLGLPTNSVQENVSLEKEKQEKLERIQKKSQQLQELILQHISFKSLISRNKEAESRGVKPSPSSAIHLPFIVVNTSDKAIIDCNISNDKTEYLFTFNKRFQIHDDIDILKRMGLLFGLDKGECTEEDIEKAKSMVPKSLESFVEQMGHGTPLSNLLVDEDFEDDDDESAEEGDGDAEAEGEGEEVAGGEGDEYSTDSSDVDV